MSNYLSGDKLYQGRAREALPLLVVQARARESIFYSELASQMDMRFPLNLNYVLGYVGEAMEALSKEWDTKVPPIQCLVISKKDRLPGEGVGWLKIPLDTFYELSLKQRQAVIRAEQEEIFEYREWPTVLEALRLTEKLVDYAHILNEAASVRGGESEQHNRLKKYIAEHPEILQLPAATGVGTVEFPLPSGDSLDVLFKKDGHWTAVEVKSLVSGTSDIVRGMFQCVKYRAVIGACQTTQNRPQSARTILVIEGSFPTELADMKKMLNVEIIDHVRLR